MFWGRSRPSLAKTRPRSRKLFPREEAQQFFSLADPRQIKALNTEIEASGGTIETAFGEGAETVKRRWDQTRETFKNIAADIGETMAPAFAELAKRIKIVFEWFNSLNPKVKEYIGYALSAGPVVLVLSGFLKGLSMALAGVRYVLPLVVAALKPLLKLIAAHPLLALIAGLIAVAIYWREIRDAIMWVYDEFVKLMREWGVPIDDIFDWIGAAWDKVLGWISGPAEGQSVFAWLSVPVFGLFNWINDAWDAVIGYLSAKHPAVFAWLSEAVPSVFAWVDEAWSAMLDRLVGPLDDLWGWLKEQVPNVFGWVDDAWGWMLSRLVPPLDDIWAFLGQVDGLFDWVVAAWDLVMAEIKAAWDEFYGAITEPLRFLGILERPEEATGAPSYDIDSPPKLFGGRATPDDGGWFGFLDDLFASRSMAPNLPLGPVPVAAGAAGASQVTFSFAEGAFRIDAPGADAREIASRIGGVLEEEMRALAEEVDGNALA